MPAGALRFPVQRKRKSWNRALVSVNAAASREVIAGRWKQPSSPPECGTPVNCAGVRRPIVSSIAPSSRAIRASNCASDSVTGRCSSPISYVPAADSSAEAAGESAGAAALLNFSK